MKLQRIKWYLRYYAQYFPFTINTLFCAVAVYFSFRLLYQPLIKDDDPTATRPFLILMGKIALWFVVGILVVSVLSTFASWLHYLWLKRKSGRKLQVSFTTETKGNKHKLFLNAILEGVQRPLLGFIKGRLVYDNNNITDKFSLLSNKRKENSIWRAAVTGKSRVELPDIKEYELKSSFIFFEDMLHLFSLTVSQPLQGSFYQPPVIVDDTENEVSPKQTEDMDIRIDQLRRVEGEYHNYKDFESGDDVRRIVWKVYAKNRDLVVRIPEMFEPYASHLYFYASFHTSQKQQWLNDGFYKEMLNYYKNHVWTVYDSLSKKDWAMRYIPDQQIIVPESIKDAARDARIISNSTWQSDRPVTQYFKTEKGSVLCISSLTDTDELQSILDSSSASTLIIFIKLSNTFRHFVAWHWLKRLIFLPNKDRLNNLRGKWIFSGTRLQILKREKEIQKLLDKADVSVDII